MIKTRLLVGLSVLCVLAFSAVCLAVETGEEGSIFDQAALIVIDVQAFYFPEGMVPLSEPEAAASQTARVIAAFRAAKRPVIHVQHLPKGVDTPDPTGIAEQQYRIYPEVLPREGETVIGKHHANSFRDTELLAILQKQGIKKLVVTGMQTHMCVEAAVRAAADYGFDVTVVHDACATRDLEFDGSTVPAAQVQAAALAAMNGNYAEVVSADEVCGESK